MGTFPLSSEALISKGDGEDAAATATNPRVCNNSFGSSLATSIARIASPKSSQHSATTFLL